MQTLIEMKPYAIGRMATVRLTAVPAREQIEAAIDAGDEVLLNFAGVAATQSFVDELIGVMILRRGPAVLESLVFKSCSDDVKAIIDFVVSDRSDQFESTTIH